MAVENLKVEIVFSTKIIVYSGDIAMTLAGYVTDGGAGETFFGEELFGNIKKPFASVIAKIFRPAVLVLTHRIHPYQKIKQAFQTTV